MEKRRASRQASPIILAKVFIRTLFQRGAMPVFSANKPSVILYFTRFFQRYF
ncbi:hypothetical protein [[Enterobacter] lignolyticus]|uniref:hypothetical protein n=1 Tax=[Enterobacter] lignolyticus TaxID=1334193 RepID=UPI000A51FE1F|nr:hypothetical protein [[Enterobacter] lignolyticus]